MRHTADSITDDELDSLYERLDALEKAVETIRAMEAPWAAAALHGAMGMGWQDALICVKAHLPAVPIKEAS